jgi:cytochrome d ubiquinol oxidase subunit II
VKLLWPVVAVLSVVALAATVRVRPGLLHNYRASPAGWAIPAAVAAALAGIVHFTRKGEERNAFLASCAYLTAMLAGAAYALYPALLPASGDAALSLTIHNAAAGATSLSAGIWWWGAGMAVAIGYFAIVYTMFRGKVASAG